MAQNDTSGDLEPTESSNTSTDEFDSKGAEIESSDASGGDLFEGSTDEFSNDRFDEIEDVESFEKSETATDSYLDDDENWGAAADEILHKDDATVIVQQEDAVVSWDIHRLYDEQGKVRSKRSLRNSPPILVISDSNGGSASLVLTKELSGALARNLENTHRAFYGIRPRDEMSFKEKLADAKTGLRENMGKAIVIGGIIVALIVFGLFF